MTVYGFDECAAFSRDGAGQSDKDLIRSMLPHCEKVVQTEGGMNDGGIDYSAVLAGGRMVHIDVKRRQEGCSRFWKNGPEAALELWSDVDRKKIGWTLDRTKKTEYVLFRWHESDTTQAFLIPFQLLRKAFHVALSTSLQREWTLLPPWNYKTEYQDSVRGGRTWKSKCMFVPIAAVIEAVSIAQWARRDDAVV